MHVIHMYAIAAWLPATVSIIPDLVYTILANNILAVLYYVKYIQLCHDIYVCVCVCVCVFQSLLYLNPTVKTFILSLNISPR